MIERTRVNKDEKREFKPHIEALYSWAQAMYPMMRSQLNWQFRMEINKQLEQIAAEHKVKGYTKSHSILFVNAETELVRAILKDPEHVMRYGFGVAVMASMHDAERSYNGYDGDVEALAKHIRACFNRWINGMAGFATKVKMEK
jgi:N-formylglutamate amidohydrolase